MRTITTIRRTLVSSLDLTAPKSYVQNTDTYVLYYKDESIGLEGKNLPSADDMAFFQLEPILRDVTFSSVEFTDVNDAIEFLNKGLDAGLYSYADYERFISGLIQI